MEEVLIYLGVHLVIIIAFVVSIITKENIDSKKNKNQ